MSKLSTLPFNSINETFSKFAKEGIDYLRPISGIRWLTIRLKCFQKLVQILLTHATATLEHEVFYIRKFESAMSFLTDRLQCWLILTSVQTIHTAAWCSDILDNFTYASPWKWTGNPNILMNLAYIVGMYSSQSIFSIFSHARITKSRIIHWIETNGLGRIQF